MSNLISGKEALIALLSGKEVQMLYDEENWDVIENWEFWEINNFTDINYKFRLKPRTITLNGVEVPAPFEPKDGEVCYFLCDEDMKGYKKVKCFQKDNWDFNFEVWQTEDEIKQVVAALCKVFNQ